MKIIDVHAHYCPRAYFRRLESRDAAPSVKALEDGALDLRYGPGRYSTVRETSSAAWRTWMRRAWSFRS